MLCPNVCECGTVSHDVCETMCGSVTPSKVNGVNNPFAVHGQCKVMHAVKPA